MSREELIQFIKGNDANYSKMTFTRHSNSDLLFLVQKIEEEKRNKNQSQPYPMLSHLLNTLV